MAADSKKSGPPLTLMHPVAGGKDARRINTETFENIWTASSSLKQRFQYNLEVVRKNFFHVLKKLGIPRERQRILDIGFGNGMLMFLFSPCCRLRGTEFSTTAVAKASAAAQCRGYRDFYFQIPERSEVLPYSDNEFSIVIASHVLEHVQDDVSFLREMLRVLECDGYLIVLVPLDARDDGILSEETLINPAYLNAGHYHVRNYNIESLLHRFDRLDGEIVFTQTDMHTWDWKCSLDSKRSKLGSTKSGRVFDRIIAAAINIPLSSIPLSWLMAVDGYFARRGYRARQGLIVFRKKSR